MTKQAAGVVRRHVPEAVRIAGKQCFRSYGIVTQRFRPPPDFLIIGTKRGGTTSMYYYLLQHPQVLPLFPSAARLPMIENTKGVHYFDKGFDHGVAWYRSHFPAAAWRRATAHRVRAPVVVGEASPYYLFHPAAAQRAAAIVPGAKIIAMLRDPVERAYSHWKEQRRNGVEALSFEEALDAEPARLAGEEERLLREPGYRSFPHEQQSYVTQSEYVRPLSAWLERFPREQVLVIRSEDFYRDPQRSYVEVLRFLGLPPITLADTKRWNPTASAAMPEQTRERLRAHFEPHNLALEETLGRDFGWARGRDAYRRERSAHPSDDGVLHPRF